MSEKRRQKRFYVENVVISLGLGLLNYQLFRPDTYLAELGRKVLQIDLAEKIRNIGLLIPRITMFLKNFASDMLWAYALFFTLFCVTEDNRAIIVAALFSLCMEGLQKIGIVSGTFDWWDIGLEWLAIGIGWFIMKRKAKKVKGEFI